MLDFLAGFFRAFSTPLGQFVLVLALLTIVGIVIWALWRRNTISRSPVIEAHPSETTKPPLLSPELFTGGSGPVDTQDNTLRNLLLAVVGLLVVFLAVQFLSGRGSKDDDKNKRAEASLGDAVAAQKTASTAGTGTSAGDSLPAKGVGVGYTVADVKCAEGPLDVDGKPVTMRTGDNLDTFDGRFSRFIPVSYQLCSTGRPTVIFDAIEFKRNADVEKLKPRDRVEVEVALESGGTVTNIPEDTTAADDAASKILLNLRWWRPVYEVEKKAEKKKAAEETETVVGPPPGPPLVEAENSATPFALDRKVFLEPSATARLLGCQSGEVNCTPLSPYKAFVAVGLAESDLATDSEQLTASIRGFAIANHVLDRLRGTLGKASCTDDSVVYAYAFHDYDGTATKEEYPLYYSEKNGNRGLEQLTSVRPVLLGLRFPNIDPRKAPRSEDVAAAIEHFFRSQGVEITGYNLRDFSQSQRLFIETACPKAPAFN